MVEMAPVESKSRKREVRSNLPHIIEDEAEMKSGFKKPKPDIIMSACDVCGEQPVGNWRVSGAKCLCGKFVHSRCWKGNRKEVVVCADCEAEKE
jgi:hypothetical protein